MNRAAEQRGNTLALVVVCIGVMALLVAFFAINYGQFFGAHREAQTAIDAAALEAAKDIGRIVVNDPEYGLVALVDDTPPGNNITARPVWGLNTLLATARLDLLIANALGNTTMVYLAKQDIANTQRAGQALTAAIRSAAAGGIAKDKEGNDIKLLQLVTKAYKDNSRRMGKGDLVEGSLRLQVGELTGGAGETNMPVPQPDSSQRTPDHVKMRNAQGMVVYKPYVNVPTSIGNTTLSFTFAAVADEPLLVDTSKFSALGSTTNIPAVVKVEADERVTTIAPKTGIGSQGGEHATHTVHVAACAQAGGPRATHPSGALVVDFPQGLPQQTVSTATGTLNFTSVKSIMNSSQLPVNAIATTPTPSVGWTAPGLWFKIVNGPVPQSTQGNPPGQPIAFPFHGREQDDPSVALSFCVYDWLKSCGLRPNIDSTVAALNRSIRSNAVGMRIRFRGDQQFIEQPAWAQSVETNAPVAGAALHLVTDPNQLTAKAHNPDPRSQTNVDRFRDELLSQFDTLKKYVPPGEILAEVPTAMRTAVDPGTGRCITPDGQDCALLYRFAESVKSTNEIGKNAFDTAKTVYNNARDAADSKAAAKSQKQTTRNQKEQSKAAKEAELAQLQGDDAAADRRAQLESEIAQLAGEISSLASEIDQLSSEEQALRKKQKRAGYCMTNASYVMNVSLQLQDNAGALTGGGCQEVVAREHYKLMTESNFFPVLRAPTTQEIETDGMVSSTGQNSACPGPKDWCAEVQGADQSSFLGGSSPLYICRRTTTPVVGRKPVKDFVFQPALAQSSVPPRGFVFIFVVSGDASKNIGAGSNPGEVIFSSTVSSPFGGMSLLEGQALHQGLNVLTTQPYGSVPLTWSTMAEDWFANGDGKYAADPNADGYQVTPTDWCHQNPFGVRLPGSDPCMAISAHWQMNSPMPNCPFGQASQFFTADGTLVRNPCPDPPPRGH